MRVLSTIIIFGYLTSCSKANTDKDSEEVKIINQHFLELVGTNWYYEAPPIPPVPLSEESTREDSLRFLEESLEYGDLIENPQLDTSTLKIYLHDTLTTYKADAFLERMLSHNNFEANFPVDTTWIKLVEKLNHIEEPKAFDIKQITETGNYTIVTESEYNDTSDHKRRVGIMTMSRIAFSLDYKRGVFYYDFTCGGLCGWGSIVFIEKQKGAWKIVGERQMWVS